MDERNTGRHSNFSSSVAGAEITISPAMSGRLLAQRIFCGRPPLPGIALKERQVSRKEDRRDIAPIF